MLVYGVEGIISPSFSWGDESEVKIIKFDLALINKDLKAGKKLAVYEPQLDEGILANAAGVSYLLVADEKLAKKLALLAEFYLFDAKILLIKEEASDLYQAYEKTSCDGVILQAALQ